MCPTGVPEDRAAEEYSQMAKALVEAATTVTPQLPLTALLVQVSVQIKIIRLGVAVSSCITAKSSLQVEFHVLSYNGLFLVDLSGSRGSIKFGSGGLPTSCFTIAWYRRDP